MDKQIVMCTMEYYRQIKTTETHSMAECLQCTSTETRHKKGSDSSYMTSTNKQTYFRLLAKFVYLSQEKSKSGCLNGRVRDEETERSKRNFLEQLKCSSYFPLFF